MNAFFSFLRTWVAPPFIALGGFAGIMRVIEWLLDKPKLIGSVDQYIGGSISQAGAPVGAHLMLLVYLVNKRMRPTTVKEWGLTVAVGGVEYRAQPMTIEQGLQLSDGSSGKPYPISFSQHRLYEMAFSSPLEYGRGVRGWLRFLVKGLDGKKLSVGAHLQLTAVDAFGGKHHIRHVTGKPTYHEPHYLPGAGYTAG